MASASEGGSVVSDEMQVLVEALRAAAPPASLDVSSHRERVARAEAVVAQEPGTHVEPTDAGGVPAEWVWAGDREGGPTVLFLHHGAYIAGSPLSSRPLAARVTQMTGGRFLVPDYRLAPEHPFPAAVDDALGAYRWLLESGPGPSSVVLGGASAGGGLALATAVAARDAGLPAAAALFVICPLTDLTFCSRSMTAAETRDPFPSRDIALFATSCYLDGADPRAPLASPLYADLTGLPALHVEAATADRLLDDAVGIAERARAAGVAVTIEVVEGAIHNFAQYGPDTPEGRATLGRIASHVRRHTVGAP